MKKIIFIIIGMLLLIPYNVNAEELKLVIDCGKTELVSGQELTCNIKGDSNIKIYGGSFSLVVGENEHITISETLSTSIANLGIIPDGDNYAFLSGGETFSANQTIASFKIKASEIEEETTDTIKLTDVTIENENEEEQTLEDVTLTLTLKKEQTDNNTGTSTDKKEETTDTTDKEDVKNPDSGIFGYGILTTIILAAGFYVYNKKNKMNIN